MTTDLHRVTDWEPLEDSVRKTAEATRLADAAPALLSALRGMVLANRHCMEVKTGTGQTITHPFLAAALDAIAAATGELT